VKGGSTWSHNKRQSELGDVAEESGSSKLGSLYDKLELVHQRGGAPVLGVCVCVVTQCVCVCV